MSDETTTTQTEQTAAPPSKLDVTVRPIEPKGNLVGFASVKINDSFVIDDFKILQSDKGLFVGMPSKPDKSSTTGYRDTFRPITKEACAELVGAIASAYSAEIENVQALAAAIPAPDKPAPERPPAQRKPSIQKQLEDGAKQAAKENAARSAPKREKAAAKTDR